VTAFEAEAEALGTTLDARRVLAALSGPVRPAMVEAVRRLDAAGLRLALLINNIAPMPRHSELGGLLRLFDTVVESSVEGVRKPDPEFYRRARARVGDPPAAECVFLDDLGVNLRLERGARPRPATRRWAATSTITSWGRPVAWSCSGAWRAPVAGPPRRPSWNS